MSQNEPDVRDEDGNRVAMVLDPLLRNIPVDFSETHGWRPASPLPEGDYEWGDDGFHVDPDHVPETPRVLEDGSFSVIIDAPDEDSGCSEPICGSPGMTRVDIDFSFAMPRPVLGSLAPLVAVEVTAPELGTHAVFFGRVSSRPTAPPTGQSTPYHIDIWGGYVPGFIERDILCIAIIGYAEDGTPGERIDLGCADPKTGENFTDLDAEGCASAQSTDTYALLFAGLVLALRRPRRLV